MLTELIKQQQEKARKIWVHKDMDALISQTAEAVVLKVVEMVEKYRNDAYWAIDEEDLCDIITTLKSELEVISKSE